MTHRKIGLFTIAMSSSDPHRRVGGAHALFTINQALGIGRNGHMGVMYAYKFLSAALCKTLEILASETQIQYCAGISHVVAFFQPLCRKFIALWYGVRRGREGWYSRGRRGREYEVTVIVVKAWNGSGGVQANLFLFVHKGEGLDRACLGKVQPSAPWFERERFEEWRPCELQRHFVIDQRHEIRKICGLVGR